jgi:hypothetical protein
VPHRSPQRKQGKTRSITPKSGPDSLAGASGLDGKANSIFMGTGIPGTPPSYPATDGSGTQDRVFNCNTVRYRINEGNTSLPEISANQAGNLPIHSNHGGGEPIPTQ